MAIRMNSIPGSLHQLFWIELLKRYQKNGDEVVLLVAIEQLPFVLYARRLFYCCYIKKKPIKLLKLNDRRSN